MKEMRNILKAALMIAVMAFAPFSRPSLAGLTVQNIDRLSFNQILWQPQGEPDPGRPFIRMAVNIFSMPNHDAPIILRTVEMLANTFGGNNFEARVIPDTFTVGEDSQIVLGSAGTFARARITGSRDIATLVSRLRPDPNHGEGSVFLALRASAIRSFEDMKGKRAAMLGPRAFTGRTTALGEILRRGYNPDRFFSEESYTDSSMPEEIELLRSGKVDVAVVRTCFLEEMAKREDVGDLVVIGERSSGQAGCRTSTDLYPNWTVFVTPLASPAIAKAAAGALLAMPADSEGRSWGVASDFTAVDALYRNLRMGSYAYLRSFSLVRFWEEYRAWVVLAILMVLGLIAHGLRASALVEKRTGELRDALRDERQADERARKATERMETLQKLGLIGQMSTIFAHELRQPLSAITAYASGLLRALDRPGDVNRELLEEGIERIKGQALAADGIVQKVRSYARRPEAVRAELDLGEVVSGACSTVLAAKNWNVSFRTTLPELPANIYGDRMELELLVLNLVKNALEAASQTKAGEVEVTLAAGDGRVRLTVLDNGPAVSDRDFARLSEPLSSSKPEGTGLGIAIVRMVAEKHQASVTFRRRETHGLQATIEFPVSEQGDVRG